MGYSLSSLASTRELLSFLSPAFSLKGETKMNPRIYILKRRSEGYQKVLDWQMATFGYYFAHVKEEKAEIDREIARLEHGEQEE